MRSEDTSQKQSGFFVEAAKVEVERRFNEGLQLWRLSQSQYAALFCEHLVRIRYSQRASKGPAFCIPSVQEPAALRAYRLDWKYQGRTSIYAIDPGPDLVTVEYEQLCCEPESWPGVVHLRRIQHLDAVFALLEDEKASLRHDTMVSSLLLTIVAVAGILSLHTFGYYPSTLDVRTSLLVVALFYLVIKIYHVLIYPFAVSPLRHLPTPKFAGDSPNAAPLDWMRQFPDADLIRPLMFGNTEAVLVNSPRALREVSQTHCYSFVKPGFLFRTAGSFVGETGIFFAEGDVHRQQRRILAGPFLVGNIKKLLPVMASKGDQLSKIMGAQVSNEHGVVVEVSSFLAKATLDVIGKTVMGLELDSLSKGSEFDERYSDIMLVTPIDQIMLALDNWFPARKWIPIEANRRFLHGNQVIKQMLEEHVKQRAFALRVKCPTEKDLPGDDLLTLIIRGYLDRGESLCEDNLVSQLRTFMVAGHESSSNAVMWCLHLLSIHPIVQDRLRSAINATVVQGQDYTYEEIQSIDYLDCFLKEVLRLFPPFVSVLRSATEDVSICGNVLPAGTLLMVYPAVSQFNPSIWGPSVNEFNPDRWYNLPEAAQDPYVLQTFHSGPRICIGRAFALLEIKVFLVHLIQKWVFHPVDKVINIPKAGFVLKPTDGLNLRITPVPLS
ncbi:cytochrome P450 3A9 [Arthroderma uncinatum]|uniref:cytochrome P450 3A9 n=1 Tax=Arthroderma uncinatum TaxID=74035 RepID=UPI00144A6E27|nr:cytochrome P450 3A9 [Arthroderma uncinatum]KAF3491368.1 cytochrome P450 3A9 [Arthroderma uncinatum]